MDRIINFFKRNLKEVLRDPIIYIFCLGFPLVMLILFQVINNYTGGNTPMFELRSLLPGIIMFSYTFVMLTMALLVSKDRQTSFLKRLYSSPMRASDFVIGYALVGVVIGAIQSVICVIGGFVIALVSNVVFISFFEVLLLIVSQFPMLIINVFVGILLGTFFNDKSAPGICSVFISLAGVLGGCWMPIEGMGGFEMFCRFLPFYPSVYIGRVITGATNVMGTNYTFDSVAKFGIIPIVVVLVAGVILAFVVFNKNMVSDK